MKRILIWLISSYLSTLLIPATLAQRIQITYRGMGRFWRARGIWS